MAGLAVPPYLRLIDATKAAEAYGTVDSAADRVRVHFEQHCEFPPELPTTADVSQCNGGELCRQSRAAIEQWHEAGIDVEFDAEMYFSYSTQRIDDETYWIRAEHDFSDSAPNHVTRTAIRGDSGDCTAEVDPIWTEDEYQ